MALDVDFDQDRNECHMGPLQEASSDRMCLQQTQSLPRPHGTRRSRMHYDLDTMNADSSWFRLLLLFFCCFNMIKSNPREP